MTNFGFGINNRRISKHEFSIDIGIFELLGSFKISFKCNKYETLYVIGSEEIGVFFQRWISLSMSMGMSLPSFFIYSLKIHVITMSHTNNEVLKQMWHKFVNPMV